MNNFFYTGNNPILIKEWNDKINIVTLDWLIKNYDPNIQVYCSVKDKFISLSNVKFEKIDSSMSTDLNLKRIKSLYGLVDVIEKYPQRTLFGCVKICDNIPNPQLYDLKYLPAYCMGFFFHLGRFDKNTWILDCFDQNKFRKLLNILTNQFPNVYISHRKLRQITHKGSPIWQISVDKTRNNYNKEFVELWEHWFMVDNNKVVPQNILNAKNTCKSEFIKGIQESLETGVQSMIFNSKWTCAQIYYLHLCLGDNVMVNHDNNDFYSFNIIKVPSNLINNGQIIIEKTPLKLKHPENLYKFEYITNFKKGEVGDRHVLVGIGKMVL